MGVSRLAASRSELLKTRAATSNMLFDQIFGGGKARASHILLERKYLAKDLIKQIKKGEIGFEQAALQYSSCPSAEEGGDLGLFGRGQMVKEFEAYCFSPKTEVGQLGIVDTEFGTHIIKLTKKAA